MPYFFLRMRYMLLAYKTKHKTAKNRHVAFFLIKYLFCKKTLRPKIRLNLEKKLSHNVTTKTKNK